MEPRLDLPINNGDGDVPAPLGKPVLAKNSVTFRMIATKLKHDDGHHSFPGSAWEPEGVEVRHDVGSLGFIGFMLLAPGRQLFATPCHSSPYGDIHDSFLPKYVHS